MEEKYQSVCDRRIPNLAANRVTGQKVNATTLPPQEVSDWSSRVRAQKQRYRRSILMSIRTVISMRPFVQAAVFSQRAFRLLWNGVPPKRKWMWHLRDLSLDSEA